ncbi:hypothetical protein IO361_000231 [Campylobacter upsaliensis]|nr:hypothetical protein [Campylobacter upsaliensis]
MSLWDGLGFSVFCFKRGAFSQLIARGANASLEKVLLGKIAILPMKRTLRLKK